jgi:hypothetical protein
MAASPLCEHLDMEIPFDTQAGTDFDWFAVDEDELIGHFTTAGFKQLPTSVASSAEDLKLLIDYFENVAPTRGSHTVDESSLAAALQREWKGVANEERYLRSFVSMADKGLFSFDIQSYLRPGVSYFRVALPETPLTMRELPGNIRKLVSRTVLRGVRLREESRVLFDATLLM